MNTILPVLAYSHADRPQAAKLLDLIAILKGKKPSGHILLVAAPDTTPEGRKHMEIAASIGFQVYHHLPVPWPKEAPRGKPEGVNRVMQFAAAFIEKHFRVPFLWLEPDCVPTCPGWLTVIEGEYYRQPHRMMGSHLRKPTDGEQPEKWMLDKVAVYPPNYSQDIHSLDPVKGLIAGQLGKTQIHKSSKSDVFQVLNIERPEDLEKISPKAALIHGDRRGILLQKMIDEPPKAAPPEIFTHIHWRVTDDAAKAAEVGLPNPSEQIAAIVKKKSAKQKPIPSPEPALA